MEFNEKLQQLRKQKALTQEELAQRLYVSRTAISKWESGRGCPNIDSLKAISEFFGVSIDELLSGDELLCIAEENIRQNKKHVRDLILGLLDCSVILLLFLPFLGEKTADTVRAVSLINLVETEAYLKAAYYLSVFSLVFTGILSLALQNIRLSFWLKNSAKISLILNGLAVLLFIISLQPYAAVFLLLILAIKIPILTAHR